jgi:hypothetical protein
LSSIKEQDLNKIEEIKVGQKMTTLSSKHLILSTIENIKNIDYEQE